MIRFPLLTKPWLLLLLGTFLFSCNYNYLKTSSPSTIKEGEKLAQKYPDDDYLMPNANLEVTFQQNGLGAVSPARANVAHFYEMVSLKDMQQYVHTMFINDEIAINNPRVAFGSRKWYKPLFVQTTYEENGIFHSDARLGYFKAFLQTAGTHLYYKYDEEFRDVKYFTALYLHEPWKVEVKTITFRIPAWLDIDIIEKNLEGYDIKKVNGIPAIANRARSKKERDNMTRKQLRQGASPTAVPKVKGERIITYVIKNLKPAERKSYSAGPSYSLPHLLLVYKSAGNKSLMGSTREQYKWYHSLAKTIDNKPDSIREQVKKITDSLHTDLEKVRAVYYWVQDNIRYIAFEQGIAGFKPEACQRVLNNRYADCKGMANLTKEMLKTLGLDARLVWIGTRYIAYDYSTPSLAVDNHMICMVILDGKRYFLDPTEKFIGFDDYAYRIQGKQVIIEDGDSYFLDSIPNPDYTRNRCRQKADLHLTGEKLTGKVHIELEGESKTSILQSYHDIKSDRRETAIERYLSNNSIGVKVSHIEHSNLSSREQNITFDYQVESLGQVIPDQENLLLQPDWTQEFKFAEIDTAGQYQVDFGNKTYLVTETSVEIPQGYQAVEIPQTLLIDHQYYRFELGYALENGRLVYRKTLIIKEGYIPISFIRDWNRAITELRRFYGQYVILRKNAA